MTRISALVEVPLEAGAVIAVLLIAIAAFACVETSLVTLILLFPSFVVAETVVSNDTDCGFPCFPCTGIPKVCHIYKVTGKKVHSW